MAHFAEIGNNNIVLRVIVVADEFEDEGENWCANTFGGIWKQTSYNTNGNKHPANKPFRKNYASVGFMYDMNRDAFIPPKPSFSSWILDEETCVWKAPVECPAEEGKRYTWDEASTSWKEEEL